MIHPIKELLERWKRLRAQYGFRRSPVRTVSRLISWGVTCSCRRTATVRLQDGTYGFFCPPDGEVSASLFLPFVNATNLNWNTLEACFFPEQLLSMLGPTWESTHWWQAGSWVTRAA